MDGCALFLSKPIPQFQVSSDKVGVEMGEKDVTDLKAPLLGVGYVLLNIALGRR
jgi:hypothetical protein